ncbi:MAG: DUF4974 domain-containing protein, partial [Leeuwenhoekiella sp.]
ILENWYDVEIEFEQMDIEELTISGKFKEEKLKNVLKSIAMLKNLEIKYVTPKNILIRQKTDL